MTPGDWDVGGSWFVVGDGYAVITWVTGGTSGSVGNPGAKYTGSIPGPVAATASTHSIGGASPVRRVKVAASTTVNAYAVVMATWTGGTPTAGGMIWARRRR